MKHQKEKSEKENPTHNNNKKKKYLGIYLTKEVKELYSEIYTTLKK